MSSPARQTLRQARSVLLQRGVLLVTGFAFVALIPRLMGPEIYGQFTLIQTMSLWFTAVSGMGAISMMTKFVPEFLERGDHAGLRRLISGMLALRAGNGLLGAAVYLLIAWWWLGDLPWIAMLPVALSIAARTIGNLPYTLFLGLNHGARFEMGELLRRLSGLAMVWLGFRYAGLPGACAGLLLAELLVLGLGQWLARDYVTWSQVRIDYAFLKPYLQFSAAFFLGNVLIMFFHQGGSALVKFFSGQYAETGYYHLAFHLFQTATQAIWRVLLTFGPLLSRYHTQGRLDEIRAWTERLLAILGIASVLGCAAAYTHGALVVNLFIGARYEPVAPLLPLVALAVLPFIPGGLSRVLAVTFGQPRVSVASAAAQLAVFTAGCAVLAPVWNSRGACYAVIAASTVFGAYGTWQIRQSLPYSLAEWTKILSAGALCSPLILLWNAHEHLRLAAFATAFLALLAMAGILRWREWRALWQRA